MDQAKWSIPRAKTGQLTHEMSKYQRPRIKLQAVWTHNVALHFFLIDPRVCADSSMVIDCLAKALEFAQQKASQNGHAPVRHAMIWAAWHKFNSEKRMLFEAY